MMHTKTKLDWHLEEQLAGEGEFTRLSDPKVRGRGNAEALIEARRYFYAELRNCVIKELSNGGFRACTCRGDVVATVRIACVPRPEREQVG